MRRKTTACLIFFLLIIIVLYTSESTAERTPVTREYFENLDKETRLQTIVEQVGKYGIGGSGILYFTWLLDDGSMAKVVFDSTGRIVMIYISGENGNERIYEREYPETGSDAGHAAESESIDLDEAVREMQQAIGATLPASGRMFFFLTRRSRMLTSLTLQETDAQICASASHGEAAWFARIWWSTTRLRKNCMSWADTITAM